MAPAIKQKVHNLPGVEYLYDVMSPEQLEIPAYITEYDMTVRIRLESRFLFVINQLVHNCDDKIPSETKATCTWDVSPEW